MSWWHVASLSAILGVGSLGLCVVNHLSPLLSLGVAVLLLSTATVDLLADGADAFGGSNAMLAFTQLVVGFQLTHRWLHKCEAQPQAEEAAVNTTAVSSTQCMPCEGEEVDAAFPACQCARHAAKAPPPRAGVESVSMRRWKILCRCTPLLLHVGIDGAVVAVTHKPLALLHVTIGVSACVVQDVAVLTLLLRMSGVRRPKGVAFGLTSGVLSVSILLLSVAMHRVVDDERVRAAVSLVASGLIPTIVADIWPSGYAARFPLKTAALCAVGSWYTWLTRTYLGG